jgi:hypothetical protein
LPVTLTYRSAFIFMCEVVRAVNREHTDFMEYGTVQSEAYAPKFRTQFLHYQIRSVYIYTLQVRTVSSKRPPRIYQNKRHHMSEYGYLSLLNSSQLSTFTNVHSLSTTSSQQF